MNPRLAKELRPLLWPWCLAAFAGAGHFVALANPVFAKGEFGSFLTGLAGVAFVIGVLVLAALPMGFELHDRTLALLLSQPVERTRLWKKKLIAATLAVLALAVVHGLASVATVRLSLPEALLYAAGVATAICSVGFYTLAMRSILMGIACAWATPFAIASSVFLFVHFVLGLHIELSEQATVALIVSACAVYSTVLLWLGRRQFVELELKDGQVSRAAQIPEALVPRKLTKLFRARPTSAVANLIRKEVCLQKPIFLVSAVFVICWLLTVILMLLHPVWHSELVGVLHGLTGTQIVLMVILTGCVSLGDDKSLGTSAWHLTLPISARRQWFIKLTVSAATAVTMAVVLPMLLAALSLFEDTVGLLAVRTNDAWGFLILSVLVFIVSFWSASMVANTVRAAITTMLALIAIPICVFLGAGLSQRFLIPWPSDSHSLQSGLVTSLIARFQLPPDFLWQHQGVIGYGVGLVALVPALIALRQSLGQFRRIHSSNLATFKRAAVLASVIIAGSFWCRDLLNSIDRQQDSELVRELSNAVRSLPAEQLGSISFESHQVALAELEKVGKLSPCTKSWLKNTEIQIARAAERKGPPYRPSQFAVSLIFPSKRQYSFSFESPPPK